MEERVKTSFIPKTSLSTAAAPREANRNPVALANLVTGILLLVAIIASGGVYFLERYTESSITSKQDSLARSREAFEPATIQELSRLNTRIDAGKDLLKDHVSLSLLFNELEKLTLSSVKFTSFDYSVAAPGHVVLSMNGEATSYNAVAVQSETFSKSGIITDPIFSNVTVGKTGAITFNFQALVDTNHINYNLISGGAAPAAQTPAPNASSTTQ